ncbi:ABC transporter substrate-binding protein [Candidatus Methylomirabilis sp.]|uniref:ABC transporter substrate-binding protein n=1 Tax=Candidatus Methylomirabilis sp. TaxID=2032687 RepID=UPI002A64C9A9|nr:ABC transporter substrate-binding protein [Candidatus Methylomirabilis sp.]
MMVVKDGTTALPVLRAAFEPTGSPRWFVYAMKKLGLDTKHGFDLQITLVRDQITGAFQSFEVALKEGAVDLIDIDWIAIGRHRANGLSLTAFFPYGRIAGGLVVPCDSSISGLQDLRGKRVGVVRLRDKNWIILRAACMKRYGFDPQQEATVVEALSKGTLAEMLKGGQVDAALQWWQLIPPLVATGAYRQIADVLDLIADLGITGPVPITLFTVSDEFAMRNADMLRGFIRAFCETAEYMQKNDEIWVEVGEQVMGGIDPRILTILRDSWRRRVMTAWDKSTIRQIERLFGELLKVGGGALLGIDRLPPGTFAAGFVE